MMWGFLGQESFPLTEVEYKRSIAEKIEILNRCGYSEEVREWLKKVNTRPRLGKAVSLQLNINEKMKEFLIYGSQIHKLIRYQQKIKKLSIWIVMTLLKDLLKV